MPRWMGCWPNAVTIPEVTLRQAKTMKEIVPPEIWAQISVGLASRAHKLEFDA